MVPARRTALPARRPRKRRSPRRRLPELLLALALAPLGAAAQAPECEAAFQAADWPQAILSCRAALADEPDSFGVRYFLAYAHQGAGEWSAAAAAFEEFLARVEKDPEAMERMGEQVGFAVRSAGVARARSGEFDAAAPWLRRAAEATPEDAEVAFWLGYGLQDREPDEAEAAFRTVVERAPDVAEALFLLGRLRFRADDSAEAEALLGRYLAADPAGAFAGEAHWMAASLALRDEAATARAAAHFAGFLEAGGGGSRAAAAHYFLGDLAAEADDCAGAIEHYRRFVELVPDDPRVSEVDEYVAATAAGCEPGTIGFR